MPSLDRTYILQLATVPSTPLSPTPKTRVSCAIYNFLSAVVFLRLDSLTHFSIYVGSAGTCICDPSSKRIILTSVDHAECTGCHFFTVQHHAGGGGLKHFVKCTPSYFMDPFSELCSKRYKINNKE